MGETMGETDLGHLEARQNLPSDFPYRGVACNSKFRNAANVPSRSSQLFS